MHGLMFELKMNGVNCEMSPEYAKDKVWEESFNTLKNQFYVSGKQHHRLSRITDKVDVVVTDHPLLLGLYYGKGKDEPEEFHKLILYKFNECNNINIILGRSCDYDPNGRMQSEEDAIKIDSELEDIVINNCDKYIKLPTGREGLKQIVDLILKELNDD
jgi:hypothetical protein